MSRDLIQREPRKLPCRLTPDEVRERGQELAARMAELREHEAHEDQVKAELKSMRKRIEQDIDRLGRIVHDKQESREVEVAVYADFAAGLAYEVRIDTGYTTSRPLTHAEMQRAQRDMFDVDDDAAPDFAAGVRARLEAERGNRRPGDQGDSDDPDAASGAETTTDAFGGAIVVEERLAAVRRMDRLAAVAAARSVEKVQAAVVKALDRQEEILSEVGACVQALEGDRPNVDIVERELTRIRDQHASGKWPNFGVVKACNDGLDQVARARARLKERV